MNIGVILIWESSNPLLLILKGDRVGDAGVLKPCSTAFIPFCNAHFSLEIPIPIVDMIVGLWVLGVFWHTLLSHHTTQPCKMKLGEKAGMLLNGLFSASKR
jgi:hypothetical protein